MRILHTADWHIGQLFHGYDRANEHEAMLSWLLHTLTEQNIDVLLISGDIFDHSNPAAASIKMFYRFLREATSRHEHLQIIITAGNHDSAHRLESPTPLLFDSRIHIIGVLDRDNNGDIRYDKLLIPLFDRAGNTRVWCMAVPYLRLGEHPPVKDCENTYVEGVELLYKELFTFAKTKIKADERVIAMGHLHALHSEITEADSLERAVLGGLEGISAAAFHEEIAYVALGHIHKAQKIGGHAHIRYCGSPLPMSFTEHEYQHQVLVVTILEGQETEIESIEIPVTISLRRIPKKHAPIDEVIREIDALSACDDKTGTPYLLVNVLLEGPEPGLRHKIETALQGKHGRLCRIDVRYSGEKSSEKAMKKAELRNLNPMEVLEDTYTEKYKNELPKELKKLFLEVLDEVNSEEEQ